MATNDEATALWGAAIVGLGITDTGKVYGRTSRDFAADAVRRGVADAGLELHDVDGLLLSNGVSGGVDFRLQRDLGLRDLRMLSAVTAYGATAIAMVQYAAQAIAAGLATTVVCVHADAPLKPKVASGDVYRAGQAGPKGFSGVAIAAGMRGPNAGYALAASRHMARYGTTSEQLGAIAVSQRAWAAMNPLARFRDPITIDDHQASRWVVEPLHLLDCCMVSNGGIAVVVTSAERARDLAQPPVHLWGWAQTHTGDAMERGSDFGLRTGAAIAGPVAMGMAGIAPGDVDVRELYDCYTYTCLVTLEDYGFCAKGEGGELAASGALGPGGSMPTNTGGGQLSSYYLWGMTPLSEAVIQVRGQGGERQVPTHDIALVSGNGGILDHHATLVLGSQPARTRRKRREAGMTAFSVARDDDSAPFFDAAARNELVIRRCEQCARFYPPHQHTCGDGGPLRWVPAAGTATLIAWAIDHAPPVDPAVASPGGRSTVLGLIELDEGPWMYVPVVGAEDGRLQEGSRLAVRFVLPGDGEAIPAFTPI